MSSVVLFGKPGCHLCVDARAALKSVGIPFAEVDITTDPALNADFGWIIPVVEVNGQIVFEAGMNPADLPGLVQ